MSPWLFSRTERHHHEQQHKVAWFHQKLDYMYYESMIIVIHPLYPSHLVYNFDVISPDFHILVYFIYII